MWYIFPQISGLAVTEKAKYYEIKDLREARLYWEDEVLKQHLLEISNELLKLDIYDPVEIFGEVDSLKLRSCMTLFSYVSNEDIFYKVIEKFYGGNKDELTLSICKILDEN